MKSTSSFDLPLIRIPDKAFYWQRMIDTGAVANSSELARSLKLEVGWVCEVLRMTRLAPDIIRAILDGRQPRYLNLQAMRGQQGEVPPGLDGAAGVVGVGGSGRVIGHFGSPRIAIGLKPGCDSVAANTSMAAPSWADTVRARSLLTHLEVRCGNPRPKTK